MKKIFAFILCVIMIFTSSAAVIAVEVEPKVTCTVSDTNVKMGETFTVTVSIDGYDPIRSGGIQLEFDQAVLEYVSGEWLINAAIKSFNPEQLNGVFMFFPAEPNDINGDIFKFTLKALEDAPKAGGFDITVTPKLIDGNGEDAAGGDSGTASVITSCVEHIYGELSPEIPAKCGVDGKKAYYECAVCSKLFDENKNETTEEQLVIPALTHIAEDRWHYDSDNHWKVCANDCGTVIEETTAKHSFEWKTDKEATEDETGLKHEECIVCNYIRNENTEIPKLDHVHIGIMHHDAVTATCHSIGNVEYWTCSSDKCVGKYFSDANCLTEIETIVTPIDSRNHVGGTYVKNQKEATCYEEGYTGDICCSGCNAVITEGTVIEKNAHNPASVWSTDENYHWKECQTVGCGNIIDRAKHTGGEATCSRKAICEVCGVEYGTVNADNHKHTELRNAKAATEDEAGYTGDTFCVDCGQLIQTGTTIPKLDHTHNMSAVPAKAATCTANGNTAYWHCDKCGKYYSDAEGTVEIALADTVIPMTAHSYTVLQKDGTSHWYKCEHCDAVTEKESHSGGTADCTHTAVCSVCGTEYGELAEHNFIEKAETKYLKTAATCNSKAVYYKSCSVCGVKSDEAFEYGEVDSNNHVGGTYVKDQKEATCYEDGYTGDICCSSCNAVITAGTVIEKNAHNPASVWSTDENYHWKECQTVGCGNIIDKAVHSGGEATCVKKPICSVCGIEYGTTDANAHGDTEIRSAAEATCTVNGYTGDTYCKDCGAKIAEGTVIPARHKLDKVEAKAATHEADGNIAYYVCSVCGKLFKDATGTEEISKADTVIAEIEHDYGDSYKIDAENHWKECGCGNIIEKAAHTFGDWNVVKEATATEQGVKERACTVCGYKVEKMISTIGSTTEPTKPTEPPVSEDKDQSTKPSDTDKTTEKSPQTGDIANLTLWIALMFVSAAGFGAITALSRKKRVK